MYHDTTQLIFSSNGTSEIPLNFESQVLRCFAAGSGGKPVRVLLDTGTDPSAIDLRLARRLDLNLGEFALGRGAASDAIPFTETILPWLRIGDLTIRNLNAIALDLHSLPFQIDMVLGYNVLCQTVLHIDYLKHKLRISHPDLGIPQPTDKGALLPIHFFEHFPALQNVMVGDNLQLPLATIDTGSNGGLTLAPDIATQLGLRQDNKDVIRAQGSGFGGGREILRGQARSLSIGPFTLYEVPLDTPGEGEGELSRSGRANIGNSLLAQFASVTLDYGRSVCCLEPVGDG